MGYHVNFTANFILSRLKLSHTCGDGENFLWTTIFIKLSNTNHKSRIRWIGIETSADTEIGEFQSCPIVWIDCGRRGAIFRRGTTIKKYSSLICWRDTEIRLFLVASFWTTDDHSINYVSPELWQIIIKFRTALCPVGGTRIYFAAVDDVLCHLSRIIKLTLW